MSLYNILLYREEITNTPQRLPGRKSDTRGFVKQTTTAKKRRRKTNLLEKCVLGNKGGGFPPFNEKVDAKKLGTLVQCDVVLTLFLTFCCNKSIWKEMSSSSVQTTSPSSASISGDRAKQTLIVHYFPSIPSFDQVDSSSSFSLLSCYVIASNFIPFLLFQIGTAVIRNKKDGRINFVESVRRVRK